jgi:hypothetical protein
MKLACITHRDLENMFWLCTEEISFGLENDREMKPKSLMMTFAYLSTCNLSFDLPESKEEKCCKCVTVEVCVLVNFDRCGEVG